MSDLDQSVIDPTALSTYFRELQREKERLEIKLNQNQLRGKGLDSKEGSTQELLHQAKDNFESISRVHNVGLKKVEESQTQVEQLQKENDASQQRTKQSQTDLKKSQQERTNMMKGYQTQILDLVTKFREARLYYTDSQLLAENAIESRDVDSLIVRVESERDDVQKITSELNRVNQSKEVVPEDEKPMISIWESFADQGPIFSSLVQKEHTKAERLNSNLLEDLDFHKCRKEKLDEKLTYLRQLEADLKTPDPHSAIV